MKNRTRIYSTILLLLLFSLSILTGCSLDNTDEECYTVTFIYNNYTPSMVVEVECGDTVSEPKSPTKTNCLFSYWCTDSTLTDKYDFSLPVNEDLVLYAKYATDYASLTNKITATTMRANVTVYAKSYNTFLGFTTAESPVSGSGIIFSMTDGNYLLITNNHVAVKQSSYDKVSYTIEDYKGNTYTGYLVHADAAYDLAVLCFKKGIQLATVQLATQNPTIQDELVSLGQPLNQNNAITYGKCNSYQKITLTDTPTYRSNVTFDVMRHSCPIDRGSSGGAILNTNLELVGINYAVSTSSSDDYICGYAIPIEKLREFLNSFFFVLE